MAHQNNRSVADRRKATSDRRYKREEKSSSSESSAFISESLKELNDSSSITDYSDEILVGESDEKVIDTLIWETSLALATVASSDLTPLSSITICDDHKEVVDSTDQSTTKNTEIEKLAFVEAELVVKHLRRAIKSGGTNLQSMKVLDALVNLVVEEFIQLPEKKECLNELMARKANFVVLSFLLWIVVVCAALFLFAGSQSSFTGAIPPT